ncbi:MAG: 23S rRNA (cytidine(2498)-2'-O)-methyltransferase RlmM [Deferrisomatales bacterium]|nr:23S rRNA (cytidine(2498)-2'-O)-methyltransferase RlmM [Deferrisomatales bacterium]
MSRGSVAGSGWLLLCRPGFEAECAAEAVAQWRGRGGGAPQVTRGEGWARLRFPRTALEPAGVSFVALVFARQGCWLADGIETQPFDGPQGVLERLPQWLAAVPGVTEILVEAPDGEAARRLWPACRSLQERLEGAVSPARRGSQEGLRLHLVLMTTGEVEVGVAPLEGSSPLAGGIPRLRHSREAPSRSALKLEEALKFFLGEEGSRLLRPGMRAVDLGAAPGGWSWVLARRGLQVVAVDNGPLGRGALDTGLVDPLRADGYTYRPERPVDWLVCDMVAPPARVAKLVGLWARRGLCRRAVFNLKLPSGDRLAELRRCETIIRRELAAGGGSCELRFKHLYHDREELTGYLVVEGVVGNPPARTRTPPGPRGRQGRKAGSEAGGGRRRGHRAG